VLHGLRSLVQPTGWSVLEVLYDAAAADDDDAGDDDESL
jgi:hypothetical protein